MEDKVLFETVTDGSMDVCACTDDLARGINITTIQTVVNYDLPENGGNKLEGLSAKDSAAHWAHSVGSVVFDAVQHLPAGRSPRLIGA